MQKQLVQATINTLLDTIHREEQSYAEALSRQEILEKRREIRKRIRELNQRLVALYKSLEELEKGF